MGDIADSIIDGEFDYISGEYIEPGVGYPRTFEYRGNIPKKKYEKIKAISKELKSLILSKQAMCTTEKEKNHAVTLARQEINVKYGKGWREN